MSALFHKQPLVSSVSFCASVAFRGEGCLSWPAPFAPSPPNIAFIIPCIPSGAKSSSSPVVPPTSCSSCIFLSRVWRSPTNIYHRPGTDHRHPSRFFSNPTVLSFLFVFFLFSLLFLPLCLSLSFPLSFHSACFFVCILIIVRLLRCDSSFIRVSDSSKQPSRSEAIYRKNKVLVKYKMFEIYDISSYIVHRIGFFFFCILVSIRLFHWVFSFIQAATKLRVSLNLWFYWMSSVARLLPRGNLGQLITRSACILPFCYVNGQRAAANKTLPSSMLLYYVFWTHFPILMVCDAAINDGGM